MARPRSLGSRSVTSRSPIWISPVVDLEQPGEHVEQRGLAAAGRAEQHDELAVLDLEVEILETVSAPYFLTMFPN